MNQMLHDVQILKQQMIIALEQDEQHFPAQYYKFAELMMDNQTFKPIHQKIVQIYENDQQNVTQANEDILKNNLELRRLAPVRIWGSVQRIVNIYNIYNPKNYEQKRKQLTEQGRHLEVKSLNIRYEGLKKCIDPESDEKLSYDKNFDRKADQIAIQDVFNFIEQEALQNKVELSRDKILSKNKEKINVKIDSDDEDLLRISYGELSHSINKSTQIGLCIYKFSQNKSASEIDSYKTIFPEEMIQSKDGLDGKQITSLRSVISDTNRWFKKHLKLKTSLSVKKVQSHFKNKLTIKRNPLYW